MMQPIATSGAVANPNSIRPSKAAMMTSRRFYWPSGFDDDSRAKVVKHERLVASAQPEFPRNAGRANARLRRAPVAVKTADKDNIGMRLGYARGNRPDTHLPHQLHTDASVVIRVLQVMNELCKDLQSSKYRGEAGAKISPTPGVE